MFSAKADAKWVAKESHSKLNKVYAITIPYETFKNWANENIGSKTVKGFRPGKAPLSSLKDDWALMCVRAIADEIIKEEGFKLVYDSVYRLNHFVLGEDVQITLYIDLYPEIPAIDLSQVKLTQHVADVSEKEVREAIENWLMSNHKPSAIAPSSISMNDFVNVSIEIQTEKDGHKERMNSMDLQIGKRTFLPEIEDKLIGKSIGDVVTNDFTVPEMSGVIRDPSLIGKTFKISFTINRINTPINMELKDMLLVFQVADEKALEDKFKKDLEDEAMRWSEFLLKEHFKQALAGVTYFEIPLELLQRRYRAFRDDVLRGIGYKEGDDVAELVKAKMGFDIEEFEKRTVFAAESLGRVDFLIQHLGRQMSIEISTLELDDEIANQKRLFPEGLQGAVKFFESNPQAKENLRATLLESKTIKALLSQCAIERKHHTTEELYKIKAVPEVDVNESVNADAKMSNLKSDSAKSAKAGSDKINSKGKTSKKDGGDSKAGGQKKPSATKS